MIVIAVANQKGGVGKTTTAVTLGHGLALKGRRVLLIDLDTQGNVADSLGMESAGSLLEWIGLEYNLSKVTAEGRPNLDVVRADKTTARLKIMMSGMDFKEMAIKSHLPYGTIPPPHLPLKGEENRAGLAPQGDAKTAEPAPTKKNQGYDVVIMDCAPSVDVLHTAALVAADWLIIPTKLDQFAVKGVVETLRSLAAVREAKRTNCQVMGIIPTFYDRVTNESHEQLMNLAGHYKTLVWAPVPQDSKCRTANRNGLTLWEQKPIGKAAEGYGQILERMERYLE